MTYLGCFLFLPKPESQGLWMVGGWQFVPAAALPFSAGTWTSVPLKCSDAFLDNSTYILNTWTAAILWRGPRAARSRDCPAAQLPHSPESP